MKKNELIDKAAEHMMLTSRGFKKKNDYPIEWDKSRNDSQIYMIIEDAEAILSFLEEECGYVLVPKSTNTYSNSGSSGSSSTYEYSYTFDTGSSDTYSTHISPKNNVESVQTDVNISVRTRSNPSLSELKEFLKKVELIEFDDDTKVLGSLSFNTSITDTIVCKISCLDCGKDNILVADHPCKFLNED